MIIVLGGGPERLREAEDQPHNLESGLTQLPLGVFQLARLCLTIAARELGPGYPISCSLTSTSCRTRLLQSSTSGTAGAVEFRAPQPPVQFLA